MSDDRIQKLENEIFQLKYQLLVINQIISPKTPEWAIEVLNKAEKLGLRPSPYGEGVDTYRILDLLDRLGLLSYANNKNLKALLVTPSPNNSQNTISIPALNYDIQPKNTDIDLTSRFSNSKSK